MGLKSIIKYNVDFQYEITTRKYTTMLNKALEQKEIKEGLIRATNIIDLIIEIIRGSQQLKQAKECLVNGNTEGIKFKNPESELLAANLNFAEKQAQAKALDEEFLRAKHALDGRFDANRSAWLDGLCKDLFEA